MPQKNDEPFDLVMNYHILIQLRILIYFVIVIHVAVFYFCLFSQHKYWNKVKHIIYSLKKQQYHPIMWRFQYCIKQVKNACLSRPVTQHIQETCWFYYKSRVPTTIQYEDYIGRTTNFKRSNKEDMTDLFTKSTSSKAFELLVQKII
jgi:hypothetical protein